jgi:hypothetical protein
MHIIYAPIKCCRCLKNHRHLHFNRFRDCCHTLRQTSNTIPSLMHILQYISDCFRAKPINQSGQGMSSGCRCKRQMAAANTLKKLWFNKAWSQKMRVGMGDYNSHYDKNKDVVKCNTGSWTLQGTVNLTNPQI